MKTAELDSWVSMAFMSDMLVNKNVLNKEIKIAEKQPDVEIYWNYFDEYVEMSRDELNSVFKNTIGADYSAEYDKYFETTADGLYKVQVPIGDVGDVTFKLDETVKISGDTVTMKGKWTFWTSGKNTVKATIIGKLNEQSILGGYEINEIQINY